VTQYPRTHHPKNPVMDFLMGTWRWGSLGWVKDFSLPPLPAPERFCFKEKFFQPLPPTYLLTSTYLPLPTYLPISTYQPPSLLPAPIPHPHSRPFSSSNASSQLLMCFHSSLLVLLFMLFLPLTPTSSAICSHSWCFSFLFLLFLAFTLATTTLVVFCSCS